MRSTFVIAAVLVTAGCSTPQERIADTLTAYGLDRPRAECVGGHLQAELSARQLLELGQAAQAYKTNDPDPAKLGIDDLLRVSSQVRDPKIPLTIARAAGRCGIVPLGFTGVANALLT